ncbi:MAG: sulfotransferase domain-containing protein [Desulfobacterales bacterium]|nr:sulfotransferase domain-containing protein [Desulfobacterales bacterium]
MSTYAYTTVQDPKGNPFKLPVFMTQHVIDSITQQFRVRDDDVFIVTYPRSGTTWMQQIVHLLIHQGIQGDQHLEMVIPYLERATAFDGIEKCEQTRDRRYFKTHLPITFGLYHQNPKAKFIYVARNPKDCAVSLYYFVTNNYRIAYDGTWDDFFELFISGNTIYGDWFQHVLQWWSASKKANTILFIKYEDMQSQLSDVIAKIVQFLDIPISPELMNVVISKSTFENMAGNSNTNLAWAAWRTDATTKPLRKGLVGDWKNHFSLEQNAVFDAIYQQKMEDCGLQFNFE